MKAPYSTNIVGKISLRFEQLSAGVLQDLLTSSFRDVKVINKKMVKVSEAISFKINLINYQKTLALSHSIKLYGSDRKNILSISNTTNANFTRLKCVAHGAALKIRCCYF